MGFMEPEREVRAISEYEQARREKLGKLAALGVDPYGSRFDGVEGLGAIRGKYDPANEEQVVRGAGRVVLLRDIGKLIFLTLRDWTGQVQAGLTGKLLEERGWQAAKLLDLGDIVGVEGALGATKTGEITIWARRLTMLCKATLPPPSKWHGLVDVEQRYRQRHVDLFSNPEVVRRFLERAAIIEQVRVFLRGRGFVEVETPMMHPIAGGAAARPFVTHHNALDIDLYLRIAPELYLKRLLVGGMERVFEINRSFRNEGLSTQHNPEFTMCELYQAYADYGVMLELLEEMVGGLAAARSAEMRLEFGGRLIDWRRPWARKTYAELFAEHAGFPLTEIDKVRARARQLEVGEANMEDAVVVNEVFEKVVEGKLINPTFVLDYPAALCPLTRRKAGEPGVAERFELMAGGMEIANAYTELNDPAVQEENFRRQLRGQAETMAVMDEDFVQALKYGMPPAGGMGVGIDRLVMVLTNLASIREAILFPVLRPAGGG